ncbi:MAG: acyltransferase domain-containing protein [Arachnia propionica]|nr:acyltransferase domain-containing protein [Arachnia propionica]
MILGALNRADLAGLGFRDEDAARCRELIDSLPRHPERLARVAALAEQLRARIGRFHDDDLPVRDDNGTASFEEGLVTLLALIAVAQDVHDFLTARGLPDDLAWATLADLGQQVHVFKEVFGFLGLRAQTWCVANFSGRHLWLGRLQYTLEQDDVPFVGVHIPETGPLTPDLVDASLDAARVLVPRLFPEHPAQEFRLTSWLLDPLVIDALPPESNLARFARRFEIIDDGEPDPRDAFFFVFHTELRLQPVDLSGLPRDSSLQRAVLDVPVEQLRVPTGRLWETGQTSGRSGDRIRPTATQHTRHRKE